ERSQLVAHRSSPKDSYDCCHAGRRRRGADTTGHRAPGEVGVEVHRSTGARMTVLGAVGSGIDFDIRNLELLPGVQEVHRISSPYKLAGRSFRPEGTIVQLRNGIGVGGNEVVVMAGPCSVETREQLFSTAEAVTKAGAKVLRGGAFKPRSSPYSFQGHGED